MKVLLLDNYDSFTFNLLQILREAGEYEVDVRKNDKIVPEQAREYDKIMFSPGPGLPDDSPLMKEILKRYAGSKSILGVCLGHQAIAEYYGAFLFRSDIVKHGVAIGTRITCQDYLFAGLPEKIEAGLYHSWAVSRENFPEELMEITAKSEEGVIMAIAHREHDVRGLQFHPESIMTPFGQRIINNWLEHF